MIADRRQVVHDGQLSAVVVVADESDVQAVVDSLPARSMNDAAGSGWRCRWRDV